MASVNKVIVLGNLGQDPEVRYTPNGVAVANVSVATSRHWKNKDSGEKMEETEWHRIVFYDRIAEVVGEYVRKGDPLYVEGRLKTRKWQDKEGIDRYTTEIVAENMQLLGSRNRAGEDGRGGNEPRQRTQAAAPPQSRGNAQAPRPQQRSAPTNQRSGGGTSFDNMDDDIPF